MNDSQVWLTGYAQRAANEWAAMGTVPDWLRDADAGWIRESNANHIRFMHVAGSPADIRAFDRYGVVCTQPAGDKERESFGRQWNQRMELMRDVIIYFRNSPSVFFWEAGNNSIGKKHMRQMRLLKQELDPQGGRFMGCRTINTEDVVMEAEYVGTMLNRHGAPFIASQMPVTETEYLREESPRRVWDDFSPPNYDYDNLWLGKMGRKAPGGDCYDLTAEEFALCAAKGKAGQQHLQQGENFHSPSPHQDTDEALERDGGGEIQAHVVLGLDAPEVESVELLHIYAPFSQSQPLPQKGRIAAGREIGHSTTGGSRNTSPGHISRRCSNW